MSKESANVVKAGSHLSEEGDENRDAVQQETDSLDVPMDKMLDNARARKDKCGGDEDGKASVQQSREVGAEDIADLCEQTQELLQWTEKTVQERPDTHNQESKRCQQDLGHDAGAHRVKHGRRSTCESSHFVLKWPPEGSTLKAIPEKSGTDSEDAEKAEDEQPKRMLSKRRRRSVTETRRGPGFAWLLPKWPPEGSTFVRSGGRGFADRHQK